MLFWCAFSGPGDQGAGSRGELCDQARTGGGEAAVQRSQRGSGEGAGHHSRAAATKGHHWKHKVENA